jgi:hypothetical protein
VLGPARPEGMPACHGPCLGRKKDSPWPDVPPVPKWHDPKRHEAWEGHAVLAVPCQHPSPTSTIRQATLNAMTRIYKLIFTFFWGVRINTTVSKYIGICICRLKRLRMEMPFLWVSLKMTTFERVIPLKIYPCLEVVNWMSMKGNHILEAFGQTTSSWY